MPRKQRHSDNNQGIAPRGLRRDILRVLLLPLKLQAWSAGRVVARRRLGHLRRSVLEPETGTHAGHVRTPFCLGRRKRPRSSPCRQPSNIPVTGKPTVC
jgi:hypothetical protein